VFEAGIGGRYDPVRLIGARETCVPSVDYEHVDLLGNTLELIASDKSDACAAGGTIIYGENCGACGRISSSIIAGRGCTPLFVRDEIAIDNEAQSATGQHFDFSSEIMIFAASSWACPARFS
jgi:dihydrofolate synthase/folylpolyglutamate synthase